MNSFAFRDSLQIVDTLQELESILGTWFFKMDTRSFSCDCFCELEVPIRAGTGLGPGPICSKALGLLC